VITSELWRGKRYAVLGLARSGAATVRSLLASGAEVVAWDERAEARKALLTPPLQGRGKGWGTSDTLPSNMATADSPHPNPSPEGEGLIEFADPLTLDLTGYEAVIVSPGVPLNRHPIAAHAAKFSVPVIGDIELFAQARSGLPRHKVVGITGTNGKSTTTALIHHILKTAGVPTMMGGNIGLPILAQEPLSEGGVYVLELSSFQIDLTRSLDCDVAVLLNITPDHLDRYDGFEAYADAKIRLFGMQSDRRWVITDNETDALFGGSNEADDPHIIFTDMIEEFGARIQMSRQKEWVALQGPHNRANAASAIAVSYSLELDSEAIEQGLRTYPGLPHRMERISEHDGVLYVNDSKATNATSTAPALAAYPAIHWILGGRAKTDELDACAPHFGHVRAAYTIGEAGPMFARLLAPHMTVTESGTLDVAVRQAAAAAQPGETVLLSPACASFDQFRDFEARGDAFRAYVGAL
jgi:UDP-N-acetylmuramoylalanine--D-glutamate ligase